jgi:hypothetical protein
VSLYSLIDTAKRIMLEDAGLSVDPVAANNAGQGQVAGIGVPPQGEPGGLRRRRRHRLRQHAWRRREFRETQLYQDMSVPGEIDLSDYDVSGELKPINERFTPADDEVQLLEKFRANDVSGTGRPERSPKASHHSVGEDLLAPLVSLGLGAYKDVIADIDGALDDPEGRKQLGELASLVFEVLRTDPTAYRRTQLLLREGA